MTRIKVLWPKSDNSAFLSFAIPSPFPGPCPHYTNKCHYPHTLRYRLSHKILSSPVSSIWQFAHATQIIWGLMKALLFLSLIITSLLTCIGRPDSTSLLQHCAKRFLSFEVYKIPGMVIAKHLLKQWKYNFILGLSFTRITKKKKPNKQFLHNYFRPMGIDSLKKK